MHTVDFFHFLELDQIFSALLSIQFCSLNIHQFMLENSFDLVQIGTVISPQIREGSKSNVTKDSIWPPSARRHKQKHMHKDFPI